MHIKRLQRLFRFPILAIFIMSGGYFFLLIPNPQFASAQSPTPLPEPVNKTWPMAGANPQRTSWTAEQVPAVNNGQWDGLKLYPQWYSPIEGYIPHKIQITAANNTIFVSSANGVYAFEASTGILKWVFPTEVPLGQSPTYLETSFSPYPKRLYLPGMDHRLYCINADPSLSSLPTDTVTGQKVNNQKCWTNGDFEAEAGFETNPLVINISGQIRIYAGNRDMNEYALIDNGTTYSLGWKYKAAAPILFSTAISRDLTRIYFSSVDNGAYALNATTGALIWNKVMLGAGFYSYWPVVYNDPAGTEYVIFNGSNQYRYGVPPNEGGINKQLNVRDRAIFGGLDAQGIAGLTPVGPRGTDGWLDISKDYSGSSTSAMGLTAYLENNPEHRTVFVLEAATGNEKTFDLNGNGKADYAPFIWFGTQSGNRFPSLISGASGQNNIIYSANGYNYFDWINRGGIAGWRFGTAYMNTPEPFIHAVDEPEYYAGGGNLIYWAMHQNVAAGVTDITKAFTVGDNYKSAVFWDEGSCGTSPWPCLHALIPNYDSASNGFYFGGANGSYGRNGDGNPPIPYNGKVYFQEGNSLIAFGTTNAGQINAPVQTAKIIKTANGQAATTLNQLKQKLADEVQKIITAGHLRPGFTNLGLVNSPFAAVECGDNFQDYFNYSADTITALAKTIPYLPSGLYPGETTKTWTQKVQEYLTSEYNSYNPVNSGHIGFNGAQRDYYAMNPKIAADIGNTGNPVWTGFAGWSGSPPHGFYALWQYAKALNYSAAQAANLLSTYGSQLKTSVNSTEISTYKNYFVLNSVINGLTGYTELKKMANQLDADYNSKISTLNTLLSQRATGFTKDVAWGGISSGEYCNAYTPSKNFIYLTPELGQYLHDNALPNVQTALNEYYHNTPYWFQEGFEDGIGENVFTPFYDTNIFLAKAYILKEPREELVKYLDTPMFKAGDLFYLQNLVAAIEAPSTSTILPGDTNNDKVVNLLDFINVINHLGTADQATDLNHDGKVNMLDEAIVLQNFGRTAAITP